MGSRGYRPRTSTRGCAPGWPASSPGTRAIPICGAGSRAGIQRLIDLPIWVFHGADDPKQPLEESTRLVDAIQKAGGAQVKLTVYPGVGHDAWTRTYADPAVWEWLFAQRRKR